MPAEIKNDSTPLLDHLFPSKRIAGDRGEKQQMWRDQFVIPVCSGPFGAESVCTAQRPSDAAGAIAEVHGDIQAGALRVR